jgi:hypothetical protein
MKILRQEEGQVVPIIIVGAAMIIGLIGLSVDTGLLFRAQRQAQIAADSGAIAGAIELNYNGSTNVSTNAIAAAQSNGVTNANQVAVSASGGGSHTGTGFVQVTITQPNPTIFMATMSMLIGGHNFQSVNVGARAVAGITPDPSCIYLLNKTSSGALTAQGAFTVSAPDCGTDINSNSTTAVCVTGNGNSGTFNSPYVRVRAPSLTTQGNCNGTLDTPTFTGVASVTDPLGGITGPITPSWTGCGTTSNATTISANENSSGIVCYKNTVQISGTVTLNASMYVFENGVEIMTGANVTSKGTIDIAGGNLKKNGGSSCIGGNKEGGLLQDSSSTLNITAPSTGISKGIAIMEPPGDATPLEIQFGSNSGNYGSGVVDGLIYAPSATVYLHDNGGSVSATGLIADSLDVCSSSLNITSYNDSPGNSSPLNSIQLVE